MFADHCMRMCPMLRMLLHAQHNVAELSLPTAITTMSDKCLISVQHQSYGAPLLGALFGALKPRISSPVGPARHRHLQANAHAKAERAAREGQQPRVGDSARAILPDRRLRKRTILRAACSARRPGAQHSNQVMHRSCIIDLNAALSCSAGVQGRSL